MILFLKCKISNNYLGNKPKVELNKSGNIVTVFFECLKYPLDFISRKYTQTDTQIFAEC